MKKTNAFAVLFAAVLLLGLLTACGGQDAGDVGDTGDASYYEFDGTWVNDMGDVLVLDSMQESYMLGRYDGRFGTGSYSQIDGESMIDFDGFLYGLTLDGDTLTLYKNGSGADEETLEGPFIRDDSAQINTYNIQMLDGSWTSDEGTSIAIDSETGEFSYETADSSGTGNINDDSDGLGLYLYLGSDRGYVALDAAGESFWVVSDSGIPGFGGTFYKD